MLARVEISQAHGAAVECFLAHVFQFHKWIKRWWEIDLPDFPIQVEDGVVTRSVGNEGNLSNRVVNIPREMMFHPPNYISESVTLSRADDGVKRKQLTSHLMFRILAKRRIIVYRKLTIDI